MNGNQESKSVHSEILQSELETKLRSLTVKRWLRTDEVALYLGTTKEAIKKMRQRRKLIPQKFEGRLYYDRLVLDGRIENSQTIPLAGRRSHRWR